MKRLIEDFQANPGFDKNLKTSNKTLFINNLRLKPVALCPAA